MRNTSGLRRGGPGRPKGVPNKLTRAVKESLEAVYGKLGGDEGLHEWARHHKAEFYSMWIRLLPHQVEGTGPDGEMNLRTTVVHEYRRD